MDNTIKQTTPDQQLINAARYGNLEAVRAALKAGANVHFGVDASLFTASMHGHFGVVQCLLKHGAKPDKDIKIQWLENALRETNLEWLELYLSTFKRRTQATALKILRKNAICGAYALCWAKGQV